MGDPVNNAINRDSGRKKLLVDITYTSFIPVLNGVRSIVIVMLISKSLGALGIGLWAQIVATSAIIQVIITLNLGYTMSRFLPCYSSERKVADDFYSTIFIVVGLALLLCVGGLFFSRIFAEVIFGKAEFYNLIFCLAALVVTDSVYAEQMAFLRAMRLNKKWALLTLCKVLSDICVLTFCVAVFRSLFSVCVGFITVQLLLVVAVFAIINKTIRFTFPRFENMKAYLAFGLPLLPATISYWMITMSSRFFIKSFLGVEQVGVYSVAWTISNIFVILCSPVFSVLFPDFSKLYDLELKAELERRFAIISKYFFATGLGVAVIICVSAPSFILFLSREDFSSGAAALVTVIFALFLYAMFRLNSVLINVIKATKFLGSVWLLMGLLSVALNIVLIPLLGIVGAGLSCLITYICGIAATVSFTVRHFNIVCFFKKGWFVKPILSALLIAMLVYKLSFSTVVNVLVIAPLGFILYMAMLFLLGFVEKKEMDFIINTVGEKVSVRLASLMQSINLGFFRLR